MASAPEGVPQQRLHSEPHCAGGSSRELSGAKVDVYSYAIVLCEMPMGKVSFQHFNSNQIIEYAALLNWRLSLPEKGRSL
jgi:hypothetical protein